jgi:hypothetical protein
VSYDAAGASPRTRSSCPCSDLLLDWRVRGWEFLESQATSCGGGAGFVQESGDVLDIVDEDELATVAGGVSRFGFGVCGRSWSAWGSIVSVAVAGCGWG